MNAGAPSSLSPPQPPNQKPSWAISEATVAKKLAIVMIITSWFFTCVSSWASTASSSWGSSVCMSPVVTHTTAFFCERPIANAFGIC